MWWIGSEELSVLLREIVSLPVAAILGSILAFRPRRRGTPSRRTAVIHAQVILAVVGALIMMVVGDSLARAFGIVGAAGLVRYRARIRNAKDAGVMLCALGLGLAAGAGLYIVAVVATAFFLLILWLIESHEPVLYRRYRLRVTTDRPEQARTMIEEVLEERAAAYELRTLAEDRVTFDVLIPLQGDLDSLATAIRDLSMDESEVRWIRKKRTTRAA